LLPDEATLRETAEILPLAEQRGEKNAGPIVSELHHLTPNLLNAGQEGVVCSHALRGGDLVWLVPRDSDATGCIAGGGVAGGHGGPKARVGEVERISDTVWSPAGASLTPLIAG
jgi:hypothetical protein